MSVYRTIGPLVLFYESFSVILVVGTFAFWGGPLALIAHILVYCLPFPFHIRYVPRHEQTETLGF